MNTKTGEDMLARWLEDGLDGEERAAFEASLDDAGRWRECRESVRAWRREVASVLPADEEPLYPEFFNHRIRQAIASAGQEAAPTQRQSWIQRWRHLWMPAGALTGMALSFWLGMRSVPPAANLAGNSAPPPAPPQVEEIFQLPAVYTPERGVDAERFTSDGASATVIVLEGLDAVPDAVDFGNTAAREGGESSKAAMASEAETAEPRGALESKREARQ